ncbi:MAG: ATP-binding cassette domain-containing protein [Chitinophagaceae bacterium]
MTISLSDAGKRFNRDWIFRHLTYNFQSGNTYAITGPNGSGKSTLLQVLAGAMQASEGNVQYSILNNQLSIETLYQHISICAPYLEVVEEMTLTEFLSFHQNFKPLLSGINIEQIISELTLKNASHKQIRNFSSGMKQRVKLAQCIFSNTEIVLLDEPCTNLDMQGIELYHSLIDKYCNGRTVIVSSNDKVEYDFCKSIISIQDFKFNS